MNKESETRFRVYRMHVEGPAGKYNLDMATSYSIWLFEAMDQSTPLGEAWDVYSALLDLTMETWYEVEHMQRSIDRPIFKDHNLKIKAYYRPGPRGSHVSNG